ncbi:hypothetical protein [Methylocapsa aurea]|uniref:hypothetical protein n=1 Tax=Methylocapsa aurea TaxID=663610 RepID=UPI0012EC9791|nr:hypothetical protein [Methylocapsa aurea]
MSFDAVAHDEAHFLMRDMSKSPLSREARHGALFVDVFAARLSQGSKGVSGKARKTAADQPRDHIFVIAKALYFRKCGCWDAKSPLGGPIVKLQLSL